MKVEITKGSKVTEKTLDISHFQKIKTIYFCLILLLMVLIELSADLLSMFKADKNVEFSDSFCGRFQVDSKKGVRQDIEDADAEESYYKWMEENPNAGKGKLVVWGCLVACQQ